jgi:hypothetical protein
MSDGNYTPHGDQPPSAELTRLRLHAEQCARDKDDARLFALADQLRDDSEWWPHLWAPATAIAAQRLGKPADALALLQAAVHGGFSQPELFDGDLEEQFAATPDWDDLVARMAANIPPPKLEFLEWPDRGPGQPLALFRIAPDREAALVSRLPDRRTSAWETAVTLLEWARRRWEHANDHVLEPDALEVLDRVEAGERFACVEYSIVLSQVLNASRIPARRVDLRQRHHHTGVGRGHVVSEAWIDDLDSWVVLDGQNGAYWVDDLDRPMGVLDLQRALAAGGSARMVALVDEFSAADQAAWFGYFASVSVTGYTWAEPGFAPVFQSMGVIKTDRLLHDGALAYPRLSDLSIGIAGTLAAPAIRLSTDHPYAQGFRVVADETTSVEILPEDHRWELDLSPGEHDVQILTRTPYGATHPSRLRYLVR